MIHPGRKLSVAGVIASLSGLVFGTLLVAAAEPSGTEDCYATGAPLACYDGLTTVTATNTTNVTFKVGTTTSTCTQSAMSGRPPSAGLKSFTITDPVFSNGSGYPCIDNGNFPDPHSTSGKWQIKEVDKDGSAGESATEPNTADKVRISIPIDGWTINIDYGLCVITVNPDSTLDPTDGYTKPFGVIASYDDQSRFTINASNIPVFVTGDSHCDDVNMPGAHGTWSATYQFSLQLTDLS